MSESAVSAGGVATVERVIDVGPARITVVPTSASGTGTIRIKPQSSETVPTDYETLFESDGVTPVSVPLGQQITIDLQGPLEGVRVVSSNAADDFALIVG